jgi:hypothetical protein
MASLEFEAYANIWWEQVMAGREENLREPIATWEEMKLEMHTRFVPDHYTRDLFNKLQKLTQGTKSMEEYFKEMELTMMRLKLEEKEEQTMARFFNGLNFPIKRIVEFLPYSTLRDLLHKATRAKRQLQEDAKYERTKGFFDSRNSSASTPLTPKPSFASLSNTFSKPPQPTTQAHAPSTKNSSKASSTPLKVTCFKCGVQGHKSFECKNTRVMITKDNGTIDYYDEDEYEAFVQAVVAMEADDMGDEEEHVLCPHDTSPSLVNTKVLTTHSQDLEDQRCNIFQTKADIHGKSIKVIIDGGSCHNLASTELCSKLNIQLRKHAHPYHVQWLSDNGNVKIEYTVSVTFKIGAYEDTMECDVVPMTVCHVLLGRPWQFDKRLYTMAIPMLTPSRKTIRPSRFAQ